MTAETVHALDDGDMPEVVRYHGANVVIDALLTVAAEAYGDEAVPNLHRLMLARATRVIPPAVAGGEVAP